jgi:hypothetical protein
MGEQMIDETMKKQILAELPQWIEEDAAFRVMLARLLRGEFAERQQTESRFDRVLDELRRDREEQTRKWEEQNRKWAELSEERKRAWEEQNRRWEEQNRRWAELSEERKRAWEEQNRKWAELSEERKRAWEESNRRFDKVHEEIMAQAKKFDRSIGALGARWGIRSERAFRDALAGILEQSFGVQVINVNEFDDDGEVFGYPEQVELDIIVKNGTLIVCEIKSSIDKAGMYVFERKARFYEKRHGRKADRLIVISPMIDARAQPVAQKLGIQTYGDSTEVEAL